MSVFQGRLFLVVAIVIPATVDAESCPTPSTTPVVQSCVIPRTGFCRGNTVESNDVTCSTGRKFKATARTIKSTSETECCEDKTGYCTGNKDSTGDHKCGGDLTLWANAAITKGNTDAQCCGKACSAVRDCKFDDGFTNDGRYTDFIITDALKSQCCKQLKCCGDGDNLACGADKHYNPFAHAMDRGAKAGAVGMCCLDDVTGKCTGNTDSSKDVACGAQQKNKGNLVAGATAAICCEDTCEKITCDGDKILIANPQNLAGAAATKAACCTDKVKDKCTGNTDSSTDYTCPTGMKLKATAAGVDVTGADTAKKTTDCCEDVKKHCFGNKVAAENVACGSCGNEDGATCNLVTNANAQYTNDNDKCSQCCRYTINPPGAASDSAHRDAVLSSGALALVLSGILRL